MTHRQRKLLLQLRTRRGRRKSGCMLVEGLRCSQEALTRRLDHLEFALCSQEFADSADFASVSVLMTDRLDIVPGAEFAEFAVTESPQGILLVLRRPELAAPTHLPDPFTLILDRIQEPGNLGTILRTAWAVGLRQVWLVGAGCDPYSPKAIRAGMGAQFALDLPAADTLLTARDRLFELGLQRLWLAVPSGGVSCHADAFELAGAGVVVGNEANGIENLDAGEHVSIPMPGDAESLNVAQATTLLLYEGVRRGLLA
ncbi:MAG: RNA methyltransferase [Lentisphaeria bacterium]|nr:RNA methyltransferase [Lentisphaeria bacterium]